MMRSRPTPPADDRILVVGIDESDIQARQEWPIQDGTLAAVLEVLLAADPRAVGLDMFRDVPIGEGQAELLDQILGSDRVFPVCKISSPDTPGVSPPENTPETQISFSDLVVDSGGILRRNLLIAAPPADSQTTNTHPCNNPDAQLFSLGLQLALRYLAEEGINPELTANQELQFGRTILPRLQPNDGGYRNVDASGYQILFNYRAAKDAVPEVSLSEVLAGEVSPEQIRDRIVLIGATTPEAKDEFYTPFSGGLRDDQKMPGVIVHAQSVSQILSAVLDDRPLLWSLPTWGEGLWIIGWGLSGAIFAWYVRRPLRYAIGAVILVGGLYGICYVIFLQGGWIPLVPPALALVLASGGVVLLDRFNKSDYGQAVYKQMKTLLRLDIEIDQTKVGEQVAEITDTDYFNQLQAQAKALREKRQAGTMASRSTDKVPGHSESSHQRDSDNANAKAVDNVDDYVNKLKERASRLKSHDQSDPPA
jgi:CHASE2 domain-containing sensor protein